MNRIASERKLKKMSQDDLSSELSVNRGTVIRWEAGKNIPDDKLRQMRNLFGCDLDWLMGLSNERKEV